MTVLLGIALAIGAAIAAGFALVLATMPWALIGAGIYFGLRAAGWLLA